MWGVGCGVWGVGCWVWGVGCGVCGSRANLPFFHLLFTLVESFPPVTGGAACARASWSKGFMVKGLLVKG